MVCDLRSHASLLLALLLVVVDSSVAIGGVELDFFNGIPEEVCWTLSVVVTVYTVATLLVW